MDKRHLLGIAMFVTIAALAVPIASILSPPTPEAKAQRTDLCQQETIACFKTLFFVDATFTNLDNLTQYEFDGIIEGVEGSRILQFDAEQANERAAANRCLSFARKAQLNHRVIFGFRCSRFLGDACQVQDFDDDDQFTCFLIKR